MHAVQFSTKNIPVKYKRFAAK